jgi:hypothetical protein
MAFGHFSDIGFVSAGYAPRAKSVVFAGTPSPAAPLGAT